MDANDLARIRYVTRHYVSLQGLWWVSWAVPMLISVWATPFIDPHPLVGEIQWAMVWFPSYFLTLWLMHRVGGYYADRFGQLKDANRAERILPWALLFGGASLVDLWRVGRGGTSAVLLVVALLGLWRAARGWPWRAHQLLLGAVAAGCVVTLPLPGPGGDWLPYLLLVSLLLVTYSVCALLDHRLLVRTLRPHGRLSGEDVDATSDSLSGASRA